MVGGVSPKALRAFWRELVTSPGAYPVFRREVAYWDIRLGGRWRLGEYFGLATLANLCLLPATLIFFPGLLAAYALLDELLLVSVILPAAMSVVRERRDGTWSLLRATPLNRWQLAAAKLSGLLSLAWEGAAYLTAARWLGTLFALPLVLLIALMPGTRPSAGLVASLVLTYVLFVIRPRLHLLFGGALGLMASTYSRSAAGAVALSALLSLPLMLAGTGLIIWFGVAAVPGEWQGEGVLMKVLGDAATWLVPMGVVTFLRLLATPLMFAAAVRRIGQLET